MAKRGSITINGGVFLLPKESLGYEYWDLGYFECDPALPDLRIYVDGDEDPTPSPIKLGASGATIDVKVEKSDGRTQTGITRASSLDTYLLRRERLYDGQRVPLDESILDSVLRFHSGQFRPSIVKKRYFKQHDPKGPIANPLRKDMGAISHNVVVHYDLEDGDRVVVSNKSKTFFERTIDATVQDRLDLEILADDSTALKYYCDCVHAGRPFYWVPNQGMPPVDTMP